MDFILALPTGVLLGFVAWFAFRYVVAGIYTVDQNERAVKTRFGRAYRLKDVTTLDDPAIANFLNEKDRLRYNYPQVRVIQPGGPYFRWPWEHVYKVSIATETINMALDLETPSANHNGTVLEAVTKDQLNIGLSGQIRYRISERNLYAYFFAVKNPIVHVMGYFVAILRERIASFEAQGANLLDDEETTDIELLGGISINDLRKNLNEINDFMETECASAQARYGIELDASLITGIDAPQEVESALAAINTAHNEVSSDISLAKAQADQTIVQSKRAVEIETLRAEAEVEPLVQVAAQLRHLKESGPDVLAAYVRNVRLDLFKKAERFYLEAEE